MKDIKEVISIVCFFIGVFCILLSPFYYIIKYEPFAKFKTGTRVRHIQSKETGIVTGNYQFFDDVIVSKDKSEFYGSYGRWGSWEEILVEEVK